MSRYTDLEVAPLDDVTSAEHNGVLDQSIIWCADSSEYPPAPTAGMEVFDQSRWATLQYTTATTGWNPRWNTPWGNLAYGEDVSDHLGIGSGGLVVAATPALITPGNRVIKLRFRALWFGYGTPCAPRFKFTRFIAGTMTGTDVSSSCWLENDADIGVYRMAGGNDVDQAPDAGSYSYALVAFADDGTIDVDGGNLTTLIQAIDDGPFGPPA